MHLEGLVADFHALQELLFHVGHARRREDRGQHVQVRHNVVVHHAGGNVARPFDHAGHAVSAFPVRVLLAAEGRHGRIRPAIHVRTVVGGIHDQRVVGNAQVIQGLEHRAHVLVVVNHRVMIFALPLA